MFSLVEDLRVCGLFAIVDKIYGMYGFWVVADTDEYRSIRSSLEQSFRSHAQDECARSAGCSEEDMWAQLLGASFESLEDGTEASDVTMQAAALGLIDNCGYDNVVIVRDREGSVVYNVRGSAGEARSAIDRYVGC